VVLGFSASEPQAGVRILQWIEQALKEKGVIAGVIWLSASRLTGATAVIGFRLLQAVDAGPPSCRAKPSALDRKPSATASRTLTFESDLLALPTSIWKFRTIAGAQNHP